MVFVRRNNLVKLSLILVLIIVNIIPHQIVASTQSWSFDSSGNYSLSDSNAIEVSGATARLKVQNYSNDASTAALYHLDESSGSSAADSSSNNNTGTIIGGTFGSGNLNNGLALNGTTGQISANDSASLSFSQTNSIEAWTKFDSSFSDTSHSYGQGIVDKGDYKLYYDQETGKINYELANGTPEWNQIAGRANGLNLNNGPDTTGARYTTIVNSGSTIYAGLNSNGTTNEDQSYVWKWNGTSWTKIGGDGLNSSWGSGDVIEEITSMVVMGTDLYVGTGLSTGDAEVWKWNGTSWTKIGGDGLNSSWAGNAIEYVYALESDGTNLYAGTGVSTNDGDVWKWNGTTWSQIGGDGLNSGWAASTIESVRSLNYFGGNLYAGTGITAGDGDVWKWNGTTWSQIGGDGLNSGWAASTIERVDSLTNDGTNLYAGTAVTAGDGDVWKWNGSTWSQIGGDGLNSGWAASTNETTQSLHWDGTSLYAGIGTGTAEGEIWKWNGTSWTKIMGDAINSGETPEEITSIISISGTIYAGVSDSGDGAQVWSWDGNAWSQIGGEYLNDGFGGYGFEKIESMTTGDGYLYAGTGTTTGDATVWRWDGSNWIIIGGRGQNNSWPQNTLEETMSMVTYKSDLYVGFGVSAGDADVWKWNGTTWSQIGGDGLNSSWNTSYEAVKSMTTHNGLLYAGLGITNNQDSEVWSWNGTTWTKIGGDGLNSSWNANTDYIDSLVSWNGDLYAGTGGASGEGEVWKWNGTTWSQIGGDSLNSGWDNSSIEEVYELIAYNGALYAGTGINTGDADVWKWNGTTWSQIGGDGVNSSWSDIYEGVRNMITYNGDLFASLGNGAGDGEVWKFNGTTWTKVGGDGLNSSWAGSLQEGAYALTVYNGKLHVGLGDTSLVDATIWSYGNNAVLSSATTSQDTSWHHIAATYDGVTMKLYIDGTLNASKTAAITIPDGSHPLLIGTTYGSLNSNKTQGNFQGTLDEVRISTAARTSFNSTPYSTSIQTVQPNAAVLTSGVKSWDGFSTSETTNGGTVTYRLSSDNGTTWKYYSSGSWTTSSSTSSANSASTIDANIATFPVTTGGILWQAVLSGNGSQQIILNSVTITYTPDVTAPTNPTTLTASNQNGGSTTLSSGVWYNYSTPYFSWSGATDSTGSGVEGYYVYFGTDNTAEPLTAGVFQAGTSYTASSLSSGSTYYLRIKTRDNAQNVSASAYSAFTYKYDGASPVNPTSVSVNPSGYTATNNFTFLWPSTGASAATDALSGVAGYQYKTGASSGSLSSYSDTITDTEITISNAAYQEGANTFYLVTVDNAGNVSNPVTATFYYNSSAPTAPQNLAVSPETNTDNSFAFSWSAPASYGGNASDLTYLYSINSLPSANTVTSNGTSTSLAADSYATKQGENILYVVAKDGASNVNYSAYASVIFTANTTAPGQPLSLAITDSSSRAIGKYRLSLTWEAPSSGGQVAQYDVFRSTDGTGFSSIGTTTSTGYIDTNLSSDTVYSYKVYAADNAKATSVPSATVSKKPTGKYTEPPTITTQPKVSIGATTATITWTTDRESDSFVEYGITKQYGSNIGQREEVKEHTIKLLNLTPGTVYHFSVQSLDPGDLQDYGGDAGKTDDATFETTAAPALSNVAFNDITTQSAIVTFETNKAATSTLEYGTSTNYGLKLTDDSAGGTTKHTLLLKDLTDGTTYQVKITIKDEDGNTIESTGHAFTTIAKPKISNVRFETLPNEAQTTVKVTWETNVPTTGAVDYVSEKVGKKEVATGEYKSSHEFLVSGLQDQSAYTFRALSRDSFGNEVVSDSNLVKTPVDSRPPVLKNLTVEIRSSGVGSAQKAQLVVSWESDEPASSMVEYGPGIASENYSSRSQEDSALTSNHVVIISELDPAKLYHLRAVSKDQSGNIGTSNDTTAITGKVQKSVIDIILNSFEQSFGFLTKIFQ